MLPMLNDTIKDNEDSNMPHKLAVKTVEEINYREETTSKKRKLSTLSEPDASSPLPRPLEEESASPSSSKCNAVKNQESNKADENSNNKKIKCEPVEEENNICSSGVCNDVSSETQQTEENGIPSCSTVSVSENNIQVKTEPEENGIPSCSTVSVSENNIQVKTEPEENELNNVISSGSSTNITPAVQVEKADASSTSRESCKYGIRCYRRNPMHRLEQAHPCDPDYKRPNFPSPPAGTPHCPYGDKCYRRNPVHFQQYIHPPNN